MKNKLVFFKKNLLVIVMGFVILLAIIVLTMMFTDFNPIIVGSCAGVFAGLIIPSIIMRIENNKREEKGTSSERKDEKL